MAAIAKFYIPDNNILIELGRLQILHSHLDHTLRLTIKRTINISIDDPGYWNETRGMTKQLRHKARSEISQNYKNDELTASILNGLLDDAEILTTKRNLLLHSVWMKTDGEEPLLHDRDFELNLHVSHPQPTEEGLRILNREIQVVLDTLNNLTRKL